MQDNLTMNLSQLFEGVTKSKKPSPSAQIKEIAQNVSYNMDKFMPDDEEMQDEWESASLNDRVDMLDSFVDEFFEQYYSSEKEMEFISQHRQEILKLAAK